MIKEQFEKAQNTENRKKVLSDQNRLAYHLMPPVGWLNDPNGLYQKDGIYHIFYQYAPENANGASLKGWGHYSTPDWIHFQEEEVPLLPDSYSDAKGAYSGSAFPEDDTVHFFYTGNNKLEGDYDYIYNGRIHWVNHFTTKDGKVFSEKETLLENKDYPQDMSNHVRDPKIIKDHGTYYMVLGARSKNDQGMILVYNSPDLKEWKYQSRITSKEPFGYMWECPDVFDLDGKRILLTCPQGVEQKGIDFENLYQNGYFVLNPDLDQDQFVKDFKEFDHGFDFYAPQSFLDEKGRRILIGWMGLPDTHYDNQPTVDFGWQHALTLPRELHFQDGILYQFPIEEIKALRKEKISLDLKAGQPQQLPSQVCEIDAAIDNRPFVLKLRKDVELSWNGTVFTLKLGESGRGRDERHAAIDQIKSLEIFSDRSSLEIFINKGQIAFSTRLYDHPDALGIESNISMQCKIYPLESILVDYQLEEQA